MAAREPNAPSSAVQRANDSFVSASGKLGQRVAKSPLVFLGLIVAICAALTSGISKIVPTGDLYEMWIETGSRLIDERNYVTENFVDSTSRNELMLVTLNEPFESGEDDAEGAANDAPSAATVRSRAAMEEVLALAKLIQTLEVHSPVANRSFGYKDVCSRPDTPAGFLSLLQIAQNPEGLPCLGFNPLLCFEEGKYDFFLPDPIIPGIQVDTGRHA
jgi:hypothetical protein